MLKNGFIVRDELPYFKWSFSQFGEDLILDAFFERKDIKTGFYVEIGAFEPIFLSNTHYFYKKGWRGLCVEPNPISYHKLIEKRKEDILLNLAVSAKDGEVDFICDKACSGIMDSNYLFNHREGKQSIKVRSQTLETILAENLPHGQRIHFMSVDCEGHDETVLHSNDWNKFRPMMVLVEDHTAGSKKSLFDFMQDKDYEFYGRSDLTVFFADKK